MNFFRKFFGHNRYVADYHTHENRTFFKENQFRTRTEIRLYPSGRLTHIIRYPERLNPTRLRFQTWLTLFSFSMKVFPKRFWGNNSHPLRLRTSPWTRGTGGVYGRHGRKEGRDRAERKADKHAIDGFDMYIQTPHCQRLTYIQKTDIRKSTPAPSSKETARQEHLQRHGRG